MAEIAKANITGPSGGPLEGRKRLTPSKAYIHVFHLYESPRCRNCGRALTAEASIARGFGLGCAVEFAGRYLDRHPAALGEGAKKKWTEDEVRNLIKHAAQVKAEKRGKK